MARELQHNVRLGIFVIGGTILLIIGLYFIGNNRNMFSRSFTLITFFKDVDGLTPGNNVRYSGIDVGTVEKITMINDTSVCITMRIDEKVKSFIRRNAIANVGTDGLMGNKLVSIIPGTAESALVEDGDTIASVKPVNTDEMLRTLDGTNRNIAVITANLKEITNNVNQSRGTLYTVLMDTMLAKEVSGSLRNIARVTENLASTSGQLSEMVSDVKSGKGTLGVLLQDSVFPEEIRVAISNVRAGSEQFSKTMDEINEIVTQVNSGKGVVNGLLRDTAMAGELRRSITNIESSSQKLNEDLEALKHNFLLRGYFKRKK